MSKQDKHLATTPSQLVRNIAVALDDALASTIPSGMPPGSLIWAATPLAAASTSSAESLTPTTSAAPGKDNLLSPMASSGLPNGTAKEKEGAVPSRILQQAMSVYKLFRQLLDFSLAPKDALEISRSPDLRRLFIACNAFVVSDINVALLTVSTISNLCVFSESRSALDADDAFNFVLDCMLSHPNEKRLVHLGLMSLANLALCERLQLNKARVDALISLIFPLWSEPPVAEAWLSALGNVATGGIKHQAMLLHGDTILIAERLLLFHGDDPRIVTKGLHLLGNLTVPSLPLTPTANMARQNTA